MARSMRSQAPSAFALEQDFNTQLYDALRSAPWWMISIALHVVAFFILALFSTQEPEAEPAAVVSVSSQPVEPTPPDVENPTDDSTDPVAPVDTPIPTPVLTTDPPNPMEESDNDSDFHEFDGQEGLSDAHIGGPNSNGTIGLGANAGQAFGRPGRGGRNSPGGGPSGGKRADDAVDDALRWLAAHQSPNGAWQAAGFHRVCDGVPFSLSTDHEAGLGNPLYDVGVSGLALCAFLGAGYTNRGTHPYAKVVARGLGYLKSVQDAEGCFGSRSTQQYIYNHATASLAMVEAYGMTGSPIYKGSAQRCLDFIAIARNSYFAWRYGVKPGDNDTSVTGWMMMALKSAEMINRQALDRRLPAPLVIDHGAFDGIRSWLDKMTDTDYGRVGYVTRGSGSARPQALVDRFPSEKSEAMTAVGVLARVFLGEDPRQSEQVRKGAKLMGALVPNWNPADGSIDMYYWYYATLAMFQVGGKSWDDWRKALETAVVDTQRRDTDWCTFKGSWDPIGPWGGDGGRVYSTAMLAMCLQVYYRYPRVFGAR